MYNNIQHDTYIAHYGIKGMRWGIRKRSNEEKTAYKADVNTRRKLENNAYELGRWDQIYKRTYKRDSKKLERMVSRDIKKNDGKLSAKTQQAQVRNDRLKREMDAITSSKNDSIKTLDKHVNNMIDKYGDRNIKSMKTYVKNGEKYVNSLIGASANANATYELHKRGDRYVPVKVRHYYY